MQISRRFIRSLLLSPVWWLGIGISIALFISSNKRINEKASAEFDYHVNNAKLAIQARVQSYIDVLRGARALFATGEQIKRKEFHAYVEKMNLRESFPGIDALNFAKRVTKEEKKAFEARVRHDTSIKMEGYPDFSIKPSREYPEYHVLTYIEPMEGNESALGLNIAANDAVAKALDRARDSGKLSSSGRIVRFLGKERHIGIALRMPLYRPGMPTATVEEKRAAFFGSVGAGFDLNKLLSGAIHKKVLTIIGLRLYDAGNAGDVLENENSDPQRLLFDTGANNSLRRNTEWKLADDLMIKRVPIAVGPRIWEAEFSTLKSDMVSPVDCYLPWYALAIGILTTLLIYSAYYFLLSARQRAVEIANDMTRDLRASESNLAEAQQMARLGSWVLDPDTRKITWSAQTARIFGLDAPAGSQAFEGFLCRIHPDDRKQISAKLECVIGDGGEFNAEHRIVAHDGSVRWVQSAVKMSTAPERVLRGTMMDITERKDTFEALERSRELLRQLTAYQDRIKEEERRRIAREIHDELGQTLLALRIDVSLLETRTAHSHPKLNEKVRGALAYLDSTVKTVRTIINNLRPPVLDLGLVAAIEWQVAEFGRRTGITCDMLIEKNEFSVDDACSTTLFRILQESLTNVMKHADASHVFIELKKPNDTLMMRIVDNGRGFHPHIKRKRHSFGLVGIEERVLALNGKLEVDSAPGCGTTVVITIPMAVPIHEQSLESDSELSAESAF